MSFSSLGLSPTLLRALADQGFSAPSPVQAQAIPLVLQGRTLHTFEGFAFSVSPRRGGRAPELDDEEVLEWIGRFLARIHTVGAKQPFVHRPALNLATFGTEPMQWLLENDKVPLDVQSRAALITNAPPRNPNPESSAK